MRAERTDVVVIGAGLAGSAAAWSVTRRGRSVVVLEAFEPGHRRGSSHGSARIFRRAYPDPLYVRLTGRAQRLWRQLSEEAGEELVVTTGAVDYGPGQPAKMYEILAGAGVAAELMPAGAAAGRWPGMSFGDGPVLFHPDGGVIDADRAMAAMLRIAAARGAQVRHGSPVVTVEPDDTGAIVHTADRSWRAAVVIAAAGPWLAPLLGPHVPLPPLVVTQVQAFYFAPRDPAAAWPVFICHDDIPVYGLPAGRDRPGAVKIGEHGRGTVTTADGRDGIVSPAARERVRAFVARRLGGLDPAPVDEVSCLYTSTAGEDFILDRYGPFVVCSPCSGHGAKFAPLTGEITAGLACGDAQAEPRFTLAAQNVRALSRRLLYQISNSSLRDHGIRPPRRVRINRHKRRACLMVPGRGPRVQRRFRGASSRPQHGRFALVAATRITEPRAGEPGPTGRPYPAFADPEPLMVHGPARVIAVCNQKGGVGKTTSTINLGAALAEQGRRVLLVDFDPQGALSVGLGIQPHDIDNTIYNLLMDSGTSAQDVLYKTSINGMDLLPSNIDLSGAEVQLVHEVGREYVLGGVLEPVKPDYDVILIDCQPSLGLLTINALAAADGVIIPLECEYFAMRGVALLMETIDKVSRRLNTKLTIDGLLATMYDSRTIHTREVLTSIVNGFGDKVFHTVINRTVRFPDATVAGEPITSFDSGSMGANSYRELAKEVLERWRQAGNADGE